MLLHIKLAALDIWNWGFAVVVERFDVHVASRFAGGRSYNDGHWSCVDRREMERLNRSTLSSNW